MSSPASFLLLLLLLAAAGHTAAQLPDLTIRMLDLPVCQLLQQVSDNYPRANVAINCTNVNILYDTIFQEFEAGGGADVVVLDSQFLGEAASRGFVEEITDRLVEEVGLADFYSNAVSVYGESPALSGRYYGAPFFADAPVLIYRKDLLKQMGRADGETPLSWSELITMAAEFKSNSSYNVRSGFLAPWCGINNRTNCYDQFATYANNLLWSWGGRLWDPDTYTAAGIYNSDANKQAMLKTRELIRTGYDAPNGGGPLTSGGAIDSDFGDVIDGLCNGDVAMGAMWAAVATFFTQNCPQAGNLSFATMPGEHEQHIMMGGGGIHISSFARDKDLAWDYIKWILDPVQQRYWTELGSTSTRISVTLSPSFLESNPWNPYFAVSFPILRDFWSLPEYKGLLDMLQEDTHAIVQGLYPIDHMDVVAERMQKLIDEAYPNGPPHTPLKLLLQVPAEAQTGMAVLAVLGIIVACSFLAFNIAYRNRKIVRMSSPRVNSICLIGAVLCYTSLFLLDGVQCSAKLWVLSFGFTLLFGALFSKTYRVHKLFNNKALRSVRISDTSLLLTIVGMLVIDVLIAGIGSAVAPIGLHEVLLVERQPASAWELELASSYWGVRSIQPAMYSCSATGQPPSWLIVLLFYKALTVLFGAWLSWQVRKVHIREMNDSNEIAQATFNVTMIAAITVPISMMLSDNVVATYIITNSAIFLATTTVVVLLFAPKIVRVRNGTADETAYGTSVVRPKGPVDTVVRTVDTRVGYADSRGDSVHSGRADTGRADTGRADTGGD